MDALCENLQPHYEVLLQSVPLYSKRNRKVAEIDVLAIKGDNYDVYEVKCSPRIVKARKQLNRIKRHLSAKVKRFGQLELGIFDNPQSLAPAELSSICTRAKIRHTYFYCGESDRLMKF